ncbi:MAG: hypothetical protein NZL87_01810 [Thermomicrobium sp.]|nr:hypothetical protein [Thermomicrobium sp.]MDW7981380.1 hypothetical protein [Thermomicrobium sp.]
MTPPTPASPGLAEVLKSVIAALVHSRSGTAAPADPQLVEALQVTVASRRELGPEYDRELVEEFLTRVQQALERRVEELWQERERRRRRSALTRGLTLTLVLLAAIPLTAAAGLTAGASGIAIVWVGLVLVVLTAGLVWRV